MESLGRDSRIAWTGLQIQLMRIKLMIWYDFASKEDGDIDYVNSCKIYILLRIKQMLGRVIDNINYIITCDIFKCWNELCWEKEKMLVKLIDIVFQVINN